VIEAVSFVWLVGVGAGKINSVSRQTIGFVITWDGMALSAEDFFNRRARGMKSVFSPPVGIS
jgi:hypothetical protein